MTMQVVERVMQTYGLLVTLTPEEEQDARARVSMFLKDKVGDDTALAVEAIKFLRGNKPSRRRVPRNGY
jgi:hypothetical protein